MDKELFYNILCTNSPEEINKMIQDKGKRKLVNAVTFVYNERKENENGINVSEQ